MGKKKKYKLIIAGSRSVNDMKVLEKALAFYKIKPEDVKEVISGCAYGVDTLGKWWAQKHNIPVKEFPAKWDDLKTPPVYIKENQNGKYNALAGLVRNRQMAEYVGKDDKLLAVWEESSKGTANMIEEMQKLDKEVFVYEV